MAAGVLAKAGYFMGEKLWAPGEGNVRGYFEAEEINNLNEAILAQVVPRRPPGIAGRIFFRSRPRHIQRWLARVPLGTTMSAPPSVLERIDALTRREPFCFKDPRFCYTFPVWRPFIGDALVVCVFRHPAATAQSILVEASREPYLKYLSINLRKALRVWELMYLHVLRTHRPQGGDWVFFHYDQFLEGSAVEKLRKYLRARTDPQFVVPELKRASSTQRVPKRLLYLYDELCALAGYRDRQRR